MLHVILIVIAALLLVRIKSRCDLRNENILFVTAHPDDESMFFAPSILHLKTMGNNVHLLCLSNGNAEKKGSLREKELQASAGVLGISAVCVDSPDFQDSMNATWDAQKVADRIEKETRKRNIGVVVTFDESGVSGHPNHVSLYFGLRKFLESHSGVKGYSLTTTGVLRKYSGFFDVPFSFLETKQQDILTISSPFQVATALNSMRQHASQLIWFRYLYVLFSRYMIVNTLERIN